MKLLLFIPIYILAQIAAPSLTQSVMDILLGAIAAGIWKLITQIRLILKEIRDMRTREPFTDHRLDDHRGRLKTLDGRDEAPYYPR